MSNIDIIFKISGLLCFLSIIILNILIFGKQKDKNKFSKFRISEYFKKIKLESEPKKKFRLKILTGLVIIFIINFMIQGIIYLFYILKT